MFLWSRPHEHKFCTYVGPHLKLEALGGNGRAFVGKPCSHAEALGCLFPSYWAPLQPLQMQLGSGVFCFVSVPVKRLN